MVILQYAELICEMFEMAKFLPPPIRNTQDYHKSDWDTKEKTLTEDDIGKATNDGLHVLMYNIVKEKEQDY